MGLLTKIKKALTTATHRLDFWSVRSSRESPDAFGTPKHLLPALPRRDLRFEVAYEVPTHTGVEQFCNSLIEWRQWGNPNFQPTGGAARLRTKVAEAFIDHRRHGDPPIYVTLANLDDLDDLFRATARELMIHGKVVLLASWLPEPLKGSQGLLPQIRMIEPELVRSSEGIKVVARVHKSWPRGEYEELEVPKEDAVWLTWPLPGIRRSGDSPVDRVVDHHLEYYRLMDKSLEMSRVSVETNDLSLRAERARWVPWSAVNRAMRETVTDISAELYQMAGDQPMTKFFDAYQVLQFHRRLSVVREYILNEFNHFVRRYCTKVAPRSRPVDLEFVDYPSAEDVHGIIERYTDKKIDPEEAIALAKPRSR